jgi:predicted signal transduction protein with EAL and GGDEF domain
MSPNRKTSEDRLLHDAVHDNLTGLPNRQLFLDRLQTMINMAERNPDVRPSVFMIDHRPFQAGQRQARNVGRRHHPAGADAPAQAAAQAAGHAGTHFRRSVRAGLLCPSRTRSRWRPLPRRFPRRFPRPSIFAGQDIRLTASIGVVTWVESNAVPDDLMKDAELAMYQAKRFGGNRIEPFRPAFRTVGSDRQRLESDLRRAARAASELTLVYQPIVELKDAEIAGFEALLRWEDPKRGTVPPSEFIPVAETSDLILELGMYSLKRAAEDLARAGRTRWARYRCSCRSTCRARNCSRAICATT